MMHGQSAIELDDLERAIALGDYLCETATEVASTQMGSDVRRVESKMNSLLEAKPGEWMRVRDLQQRLSGRVNADRFHKALRAQIKLGRLEADPPGESDPSVSGQTFNPELMYRRQSWATKSGIM